MNNEIYVLSLGFSELLELKHMRDRRQVFHAEEIITTRDQRDTAAFGH